MHARSRPVLLIGVCLLLVSAAVPGTVVGAGAAPDGSHGPAAEPPASATDRSESLRDPPPVRTTYRVGFDDAGRVQVVARVEVPERISRLTATLPDDVAVVDASGFYEESDGTWEWTRGGSTPTITFRPQIPSNRGSAESYSVRGDDWAFVNDNDVDLSLHAWGSEITWASAMATTDGYADPDMAFVGNVTTLESDGAGGASVTVAVPSAHADGVDATAVAGMIADAHRTVVPDEPRTDVNVFVVPSLLPTVGGFASSGSSALAVDADVVRDGVVTHEYVHTRQRFERTAETEWLVEAEASYYETLVPRHRGTLPADRFRGYVRANAGDAEERLADPSRGRAYAVATGKGPHVLAALDREIRLATHGERTLQDVLAVTTHAEGRLAHEAFRDAVVRVGGDALGPWVDRYVRGSDLPETVPRWRDLPPATWTPETASVAVCVDGTWYERGATVETAGLVTVASDGYGTVSADGSTGTAGTPSACRPGRTDGVPRGAVTTYRVESNASLVLSDGYGDATARVATVELVEPTPEPTPTERRRPTATPVPTVTASETAGDPVDRRTAGPAVGPPEYGLDGPVVFVAGYGVGLRAVGLILGALSTLVAAGVARRD